MPITVNGLPVVTEDKLKDLERDFPANVYLNVTFALLLYLVSNRTLIFSMKDVADAKYDGNQLHENQSIGKHITVCLAYFKTYWRTSRSARFTHRILAFPVMLFVTWCSIFSALFCRDPLSRRYWNYLYESMVQDLSDPRLIRDLALGMRPLILSWLCLNPLTALFLMFNHNVRAFLSIFFKPLQSDTVKGYDCLVVKQSLDLEKQEQNVTFFHSPTFTLVALTIYLLGLPGFFSYWLFMHTGIDALLGHVSANPQFPYVFIVIQCYLSGLGCCLCALFFKSYFTFPLNFTSGDYDVEIYPDMIKSLPIKGWFRDFILFRGEHIPSQIEWKDVTEIVFVPSATSLQDGACSNKLKTFVNKLAAVQDSLTTDFRSDAIRISTATRHLEIKLKSLTREQKAEIFVTARKYAPSIFIDAQTQQALVGSTVMNEPRYTQIWFDVFQQGMSLAPTDELTDGSTLQQGKFTVLQKLATGGQAVTYLCADAAGKPVVLKEFQLAPGESLDVLIESARAFENESTILGQLSHPGIVKMIDMFHEGKRVYLVLEHVEGKTLRQLVESDGAIQEKLAARLGLQMCDLLNYLHSQNPPIVHRDFTPDNLMLRADGKLILIDFSVAECRMDKSVSNCAGKHAYTPPEQFRGEATGQSDIYAAGCTLYFLLTGQDPTPITRSTVTGCGASEQMRTIVERATELSLEKRDEDAQWLKMGLLSLLGEERDEKQDQVDGFQPDNHDTGNHETGNDAEPPDAEPPDAESSNAEQPDAITLPNEAQLPVKMQTSGKNSSRKRQENA